jgi:hypothetical protein
VLRAGSDVWYEYCEILPRLAPGVLVHLHDIGLPSHYPQIYFERHWYWNEQYLLQAFLTFNSRFRVLWAGSYMHIKQPEVMRAVFSPEFEQMQAAFPGATGASWWLQVV